MDKSRQFILWFKDLGIEDVPCVGGKNAALGEMYANLTQLGIRVPNGFALTAYAYRHFLKETGLEAKIREILEGLNTHDLKDLQRRAKLVREAILAAELPLKLQDAIKEAYGHLARLHEHPSPDVAVRSSATAEDLPDSSFAGQQETFLNVSGAGEVLIAAKKCIASLFTDRAISYRADKGFSHSDIALSVGIQRMVRSDLGASGVAFTLDTETGFENAIIITGSYGLGEMIVQGKVIPDEFVFYKPALASGKEALLGRTLGDKRHKMVYATKGIRSADVPPGDRNKFCLDKKEALKLAEWCLKIEEHFSKKRGHRQPMDIEWAKDGKTGELYIVQARPETVHGGKEQNVVVEHRLTGRGKIAVQGIAVGTKIGFGHVRVLSSAKEINKFKRGEVLVTEITDPDWEPIMKIASAIVTDKGGRTSHAAIVSRELGIPCVVGTGNATRTLKNGQMVTVDASSGSGGKIYEGRVPFKVLTHKLGEIPHTRTKVMVNIGSPDEAFQNHYLPVQGVGLGRLEFIIASQIGIHPNALLNFAEVKRKDPKLAAEIEARTAGYGNKADYYVEKLAQGIARIAAGFDPHEVIIRFSDFKTNEYRALLGGSLYEPEEENPMLGWRGASRYHDPRFEAAFGLECKAIKIVREEMGLVNVTPMVPFCRTPEEGEKVVKLMAKHGLDRKKDKDLRIYVMCEIPSNILRAGEFLGIFDGMSIGSNDLTQLTLGLDRDSGISQGIGNENDEAVKELISRAIHKCRAAGKYIGICGQAPSDYPDFAEFLVKEKITSISLNPDSVLTTIPRIAKAEQK